MILTACFAISCMCSVNNTLNEEQIPNEQIALSETIPDTKKESVWSVFDIRKKQYDKAFWYVNSIKNSFNTYIEREYDVFSQKLALLDAIVEFYNNDSQKLLANEAFKKLFGETENLFVKLTKSFKFYAKNTALRVNNLFEIRDSMYNPVFPHAEKITINDIWRPECPKLEKNDNTWDIYCKTKEAYHILENKLSSLKRSLYTNIGMRAENFSEDFWMIHGMHTLLEKDTDTFINNTDLKHTFYRLESNFFRICFALDSYIYNIDYAHNFIKAIKKEFPAHLFAEKTNEKQETESPSTSTDN